MTPSGVEQLIEPSIDDGPHVIETMTPSGVEQPSVGWKASVRVIETMTPPGVEQLTAGGLRRRLAR